MMNKKLGRLATPPDDGFPKSPLWIVSVVSLFAAIVVVVYVSKFGQDELSPTQATWGAFGDYVGGLINPAVGLAMHSSTILLVAMS